MWPFHQTNRTPPSEAMKAANRRRSSMERDVVAQRAHPHRIVANTLKGDPKRRPHEVLGRGINKHRHDERGVVEPVRVRGPPHRSTRVSNAADPTEARERRHLAEEEVRDDGEGERDHQEVDPGASACQRAKDQADRSCDRDPEHTPSQGCQPRFSPFELPVVTTLPSTNPAVRRARPGRARPFRRTQRERSGLRPRPEEKNLREDEADPVGIEDERSERRRDQDPEADGDPGRPPELVGREAHAGLPNNPSGRNARTIASSTKREDDRVEGVVPRQVGGGEVRDEAEQERADGCPTERAHTADDHHDERIEQPVPVDAGPETCE